MDFETRAIHEGQQPDTATGAITTPIYLTSTYVQEAVGQHKGYDYSRVANPTRTALQQCLASLEGAEHGVAFSSGLGATTTLMHLVSPGERVVSVNDVYGGVYRMFSQVYEPKGFDNTFATPYLQQPLDLGADVVIHSTTKYLGGHSDVIGGFAATNDPTIAERLRFLQKSLGAVPGPFDSWLVLRGIKTLALRMRQHCLNAMEIAAVLERHSRVERVFYPGLPSHPGHATAARQMRDFGGMVSFLAESPEEAEAIAARTQLFQLAESLGGVESLIEVPARMTHAATADAPFAAPPSLVRLSVGIESAADLMDDLEQALVPVTARSH